MGFVQQEKAKLKCSGLDININRQNQNFFILEEDVSVFLKNLGYNTVDQTISDINTKLIERLLKNNPFIRSVEVYISIKGELVVDIVQRTPILVFPQDLYTTMIFEECFSYS